MVISMLAITVIIEFNVFHCVDVVFRLVVRAHDHRKISGGTIASVCALHEQVANPTQWMNLKIQRVCIGH